MCSILFLSNRERMITMAPSIEPMLYCDPQAEPPAGFCPVCGGELYRPCLLCLRCERDGT